jgi:hypothetical protein
VMFCFPLCRFSCVHDTAGESVKKDTIDLFGRVLHSKGNRFSCFQSSKGADHEHCAAAQSD